MGELFDLHFTENGKRFTYKLNPEQSGSIYLSIGQSFSSNRAAGFDFEFRARDRLTGILERKTFYLDTGDTINLYRQLGSYLQKRYPDSEPRFRLHEAMT